VVIVSGPISDHRTAVLLAQEEFSLHSDLLSNAASMLPLTQGVIDLAGLCFMHDPL